MARERERISAPAGAEDFFRGNAGSAPPARRTFRRPSRGESRIILISYGFRSARRGGRRSTRGYIPPPLRGKPAMFGLWLDKWT